MNHFGFWNAIGLNQPQGLLIQGGSFLVLMVLLQNLVFLPFLKIQEERKAQTTGKKDQALLTQNQASDLLKKYESALENAKLKAVQTREAIAIDAENQEKTTLLHARKVSDESLKKNILDIEKQATAVQQDLEKSIPDFATEIYNNVFLFEQAGKQS